METSTTHTIWLPRIVTLSCEKTKQLVFITQKKCDLNDTSIIAADEFAPRMNGNTVNTRCEYDVVVNVSHITPMENLDINK